MLLAPKGVKVLAVLGDRQKETVVNFFDSIPIRLKGTIKRVCTDMYQGFVGAAQEQLPGAKIVVDRFHVAQAYRDCADTVRSPWDKTSEAGVVKGGVWADKGSDVAIP